MTIPEVEKLAIIMRDNDIPELQFVSGKMKKHIKLTHNYIGNSNKSHIIYADTFTESFELSDNTLKHLKQKGQV